MPGHDHAATALIPPMTRKARKKASSMGPLCRSDRPARSRAGEPSCKDTYDGSDPPKAAGGCDTGCETRCDIHPPTDRASGQQGGVAPVFPLPADAARVVRSSSTNPEPGGAKWEGGL